MNLIPLFLANIRFFIIFFVFTAFYLKANQAFAQKTDTLQISLDSNKVVVNGTKDTLPTSKNTKLKTTVKFSAKDSIKVQVKKKKVALYEKAQIDYGQTQLKSARIFMDMEAQIVQARPKFDSLNKEKMLDKPFLKENTDEFVMDSVDYNLNTQKGLIFNVVTKQGEGFIAGKRVKKDEENILCISDGHYTTCDLAHPHFRIVAKKIKITKKQNVIVGPFYMEVGDVPTPLGFAFGIFPKPQEKTSGILIPEYGESRENGFFLRGGGYYWAISDYLDARITGEIYTYGNWGIGNVMTYQKRYAYRGGLNFSYRSLFDNPLDEFNRVKSGQFSLSWSHTPESKGTGRFSANANIASQNFNRTSTNNIQTLVNTNLSSSISYSKTFRNLPFSLSLTGRHQQNLSNNEVSVYFPDANFTMNQIFPFRKLVKSSRSFLSNVGFNYNLGFSNVISNRVGGSNYSFATTETRKDSIYAFKPENFSLFLQNAKINLSHNSTLSIPFKILKYFNASASTNISQTFYQKQLSYEWIPKTDTTGAVNVDTLNRWGTSYRYSFSGSLGTNIYGFYNFPNSKGRLQAIRHTMIPNVSLSYTPDFSTEQYGFFQKQVQTGYNNSTKTAIYSDLPKFLGSDVGVGKSANLGISLRNTIEAKLRPNADTAGAKPEKIKLLDELSFSTGYNMLADKAKGQFAWGNVNISARTRLFGRIDVNFTSTLDPYLYKDTISGTTEVKKKTFDLAWANGRLGKITNSNLSFSTTINPNFFKKKSEQAAANTKKPAENTALRANQDLLNTFGSNNTMQQGVVQSSFGDVNKYVDFDVDWSLALGYNLSITNIPTKSITQTLNFRGDISLTKNWKLNFNSNYDFQAKNFGASMFSFTRNLHCWQMAFDWQPFGQYQSYSFRLNANASTLKDLKVDRKRTWYDR
ncbi:MAG: putative LPS assembly protein LptD [Thermonemataceae bacterium]|nr:putative LPS assembly protein LptD [Thermonemataceae bacterium]